MRETPHLADRYEYRSDAIFRFVRQEKRVRDIAEMLRRLLRARYGNTGARGRDRGAAHGAEKK